MTFLTLKKYLPFIIAGCAFTAAADPQETAKDLAARTDAIVRELQILRGSGDLSTAAARALIQKEMSPIIDFRKFAGQAVGKHWRRTPDGEKAEITAAFQILIENTYAKVLAQYSNQAAQVVESKLRGDGKTQVGVKISDGRRTVGVDYIFHEIENGGMRIIDIKVEGVSLLANYRRQFSAIIKKSGTTGLAHALRQLAARK